MEINEKTIRPTGDRLLIKVLERDEETKGGLITSDTASNSAPVVGDVIRVGEMAKYQTGQTVMFRRYSVDEIRVLTETGEEDIFYFIESGDVLGVIEVEPLPVNKYGQIAERKELARQENHANEETEDKGQGDNKGRSQQKEDQINEKGR